MKARVLKVFRDKHSGKVYKVDEIITVTKKRFAEILETAPLVEEVVEEQEAE